MVTKVTARIGLVACLAALVAGVPTNVVAATTHAAHVKPVGDHCLVGTWRARPAQIPVEFHHRLLKLHYGGGDYLHITGKGAQVDRYAQSRLFEGFPNGFDLKLHIRGQFDAHVRGLEGTSDAKGKEIRVLKETGGGWLPGSFVHATYNGQPLKFHFFDFRAHYDAYTCSNTALILMDGSLNVHQTYSRRSFAP